MTRKQDSAAKLRWKEEVKQILAEDRDLLKSLIQEALQAEKGERTQERLGYRSSPLIRTTAPTKS